MKYKKYFKRVFYLIYFNLRKDSYKETNMIVIITISILI